MSLFAYSDLESTMFLWEKQVRTVGMGSSGCIIPETVERNVGVGDAFQ